MNNKSQREQQTATATSCLVAATQHGGLAEEGETKLAIYVAQGLGVGWTKRIFLVEYGGEGTKGEESSDHPRGVGVETQYRMSNKLRITEAKPEYSVWQGWKEMGCRKSVWRDILYFYRQ
jgi:hypothetical protein